VGYPGNVAFFERAGSLHGFESMQESALELATSQGDASSRSPLQPSGLDYSSPLFTEYLSHTSTDRGAAFRGAEVRSELAGLSAGELRERTILSFQIEFEPNQKDFSGWRYGTEFQRVLELASKYGNAVIAVRGHSDPTKTLMEVVKAGRALGVLERRGSRANREYLLDGSPLELSDTSALLARIDGGAFDGATGHDPRTVVHAAEHLSAQRAERVRDAILTYAKRGKVEVDASQIQPVGVGIREPRVPTPRSLEEAKQNMRVEFVLMRVEAEVSSDTGFDY